MTYLQENRYDSASLVIDNGSKLWVTGGYNLDHRLETTEIVELNDFGDLGLVSYGPKLPHSLMGHSMVLLNDSLAMMIGGSQNIDSDLTYFYEFESSNWKNGPNLGQNQNKNGVMYRFF